MGRTGRQRGKATPTFSLFVVAFYLTLFPYAPAATSYYPECSPFRRIPPRWPCRNHPKSPATLTPSLPADLATPPPIPQLSPPPIPKPPTPPRRRRPFPPPCVLNRCPDQPCPPPIGRNCPGGLCPPYRPRCPPLPSKRGRVNASPPKEK